MAFGSLLTLFLVVVVTLFLIALRSLRKGEDDASAIVLRPQVVAPWLLLLALLGSAWMLPYRLPASDEGAILTQAAKILRGAVYYRDIDAYPFPGAPYLLARVMAVFGEHLTVARCLAAAVFCGIVLGVYSIALQVLDRRRATLIGLALLSFKFIAWPGLTSFCYWDLAFCFGCFAIALFLGHSFRGPTFRLAAAGGCAGIALVSKQTVGIYSSMAIVALLLYPGFLLGVARERSGDRWREIACYLLGFAAPVLPMLGYFAAKGVLPAMLFAGLLRPFVAYLPTSGLPFNIPLRWWELGQIKGLAALPYFVEPYWQMVQQGQLPGESLESAYWLAGEIFSRLVYTALPVAFLATLVSWARAKRAARLEGKKTAFAFAFVAAGVVCSAFPRADFPHVISVYPLVLVLLFHLWGRLGERGGNRWVRRFSRSAELAAVAFLLAASIGLTAIQHGHLTYHMKLEKADLYVSPENAYVESIVKFVEEELAPEDPFLVLVHEAHYYFLTGRFYPWPFVQLYPGMTGDAEGRELAASLEELPPKLIVRGMIRMRGVPQITDYAPAFAAAIARSYVPDPRVFRRHVPPAGRAPPVLWVRVLRPRTLSDSPEK